MVIPRNKLQRNPFRKENPYAFTFDLTSQKLMKSNQLTVEERLQQIENFKAGLPEGYGKTGGRYTQDQILKMKKARKVRVTSLDNE